MKKKHRHNIKGKNFIILPFIFCLLIYLALFFALSPIVSSVAAMGGLVFSDNEKDFSTSYNNIFVPTTNPNNTNGESGKTTVPISQITYPKLGEQFGELYIEQCAVNAKLFFGDGNIPLRNGVGIYNGSSIPGYGKTILVAGHNNTYFNGLKNAEAGQTVQISTSYGNYTYEITGTDIKKADDNSAFDLNANEENLVMYTCYPFDALGLTENRFFVYAKFVSGPVIDKNH